MLDYEVALDEPQRMSVGNMTWVKEMKDNDLSHSLVTFSALSPHAIIAKICPCDILCFSDIVA